MTKFKYLNQCKNLIRKVLEQRKEIDKQGGGYVPKSIRADIPNIENAMTTIKSEINMKEFLLRKKAAIKFLIPANNTTWQEEFTALLETNINTPNE